MWAVHNRKCLKRNGFLHISEKSVVKPMILLWFCTSADPKPISYNLGCSFSCHALGPGEASETLQNQCFFLQFRTWRARRERPPNGSRRAKNAKYIRKMNVFRKCLGGSLVSTLGGHFLSPHPPLLAYAYSHRSLIFLAAAFLAAIVLLYHPALHVSLYGELALFFLAQCRIAGSSASRKWFQRRSCQW